MKKNIIIIILTILVVGLAGYLVYDKMYANELPQEENNLNNQEQQEQQNTSSTKLNDVNKISQYKNEDGTYGVQKSFSTQNYTTKLNLVGEVEVCSQVGCKKITNLDKVVDMLEWSIPGPEIYQKIAFLLDDGTIYTYSYDQYEKNDLKAIKNETLQNVDRIFGFSYHGTNSGGCHGGIAVTQNNEYHEIFKECV